MGRGPSYPYVNLEEALGVTKKIYEYIKRSAASTDAVVENALNYSLKSTSGIKTIAALKAFGLIEEVAGSNGKSIKITDRAFRILIDRDSQEALLQIKEAALSPRWYLYCWQKWGSSFPPAMRATLIIDHGFVPSTVDGFLSDYKKSIDFAGIRADPPNEMLADMKKPEGDGQESYIEGIQSSKQESGTGTRSSSSLLANTLPVVALSEASKDPKMHVETFSLPDGVVGQLQWPASISQEAYDDFVYQIEGLRRRVNRAVRKDSASEENTAPRE